MDGQAISVGAYGNEKTAAQARDYAMLRVFGMEEATSGGFNYPEELREFVDVDVVLKRLGIKHNGPSRENMDSRHVDLESDDEGETG